MSSELELYFFGNERTIGDSNYITDGYLLLSKEFTQNRVLKDLKNVPDNSFMQEVPFYRGQDIDLNKIGNECYMCSFNRIGIKIKENDFIDYRYFKMFENHLDGGISYTVQDFENGSMIKLFKYSIVFDKEIFAGAYCSFVENIKD